MLQLTNFDQYSADLQLNEDFLSPPRMGGNPGMSSPSRSQLRRTFGRPPTEVEPRQPSGSSNPLKVKIDNPPPDKDRPQKFTPEELESIENVEPNRNGFNEFIRAHMVAIIAGIVLLIIFIAYRMYDR